MPAISTCGIISDTSSRSKSSQFHNDTTRSNHHLPSKAWEVGKQYLVAAAYENKGRFTSNSSTGEGIAIVVGWFC